MIIINGNTYKHKEVIKSLGFKWNPKFKTWDKNYLLSEEQKALLGSLNGIEVTYYNEKEGNSNTLIDTRSFKQKYGRCEDAPCCGCCGIY